MNSEKRNIIVERSEAFGEKILDVVCEIKEQKRCSNASRQIEKSSTSIGANVGESQFAQSPSDFSHKLHLALKEANETKFWLKMLLKQKDIDQSTFDSLTDECLQIIYILLAIIKTTNDRYGNKNNNL